MSSSTIEANLARGAGLHVQSWPAALARPIKLGIAWIRFRRQLRRDVKELMALDDHLLADIGLKRGQIEYVVQYGHLPAPIKECVMADCTKINIDGHWVSPRGGTTAKTINPATGKCGGRMSLPPLPMLTSPACESRDTNSHTFCTCLRGEGPEPEADMSAISVFPVGHQWLTIGCPTLAPTGVFQL
jgi:uncharacterized protein YjiS (DUF1127 family)